MGLNQKILESAQKVAAFPKTTPIYYYAGHGEDECDPVNHKPIVRQVPNDCIYITITECGVYAEIDLFDNPREKLFRSKAPEIKSLLQYPYKITHYMVSGIRLFLSISTLLTVFA